MQDKSICNDIIVASLCLSREPQNPQQQPKFSSIKYLLLAPSWYIYNQHYHHRTRPSLVETIPTHSTTSDSNTPGQQISLTSPCNRHHVIHSGRSSSDQRKLESDKRLTGEHHCRKSDNAAITCFETADVQPSTPPPFQSHLLRTSKQHASQHPRHLRK